jgi:serine/threonine-protein kinase
MPDSLTGREINGYRIGPLLGAGGMGEVYQAVSLKDQSVVAIKFLRGDNYDPKMQGRFAREIRIMQDLNHPNIMPIYSSGIAGDMLYYTMHLVNGQTLATFVRRRKLSPLELYPILEQLVSALAYGHSVNLVHRDLKPDNVFIERNRQTNRAHIYLGDFGLGKRTGIDQTLTEADAVLGTPHYMAPEAVLGEPLTHRTDLYALGIIVYEILVGRVPYSEEQGHLTAMAHVTRPIPPPTHIHPNFPKALEQMLLKALEKRPENRYESATDFLNAYIEAMNAMTPEERTTIYSAQLTS